MATFDGLVFLVLYLGRPGLTAVGIRRCADPSGRRLRGGGQADQAGLGGHHRALDRAVIFWQQNPMSFFGLPAVIAAVVYLVDVRPAVRGLRRGNSW